MENFIFSAVKVWPLFEILNLNFKIVVLKSNFIAHESITTYYGRHSYAIYQRKNKTIWIQVMVLYTSDEYLDTVLKMKKSLMENFIFATVLIMLSSIAVVIPA